MSCPGRWVRMVPASFRPKISPFPPFEYTQGMLFQSVVRVHAENSPFEKGGFEFSFSLLPPFGPVLAPVGHRPFHLLFS